MDKKLNIGIDIDGVLTDVGKYQLEFGSAYFKKPAKNPHEYDVTDMFNISEVRADQFWDEHLFDYALSYPARDFASQTIKRLHSAGHKISIVTARDTTSTDTIVGAAMRAVVKQWLKENKLYYDQIVFTDEDKVPFCAKHKIDIMIDDKPENIMDISTIIPVIAFDCPYNTACKNENIHRAFAWTDVEYIIKKLSV